MTPAAADRAREATREKLRVLVSAPNPPPFGGIVSVVDAIVGGPLRERFEFERFGTTRKRAPTLPRPFKWLNSAVARAAGLEGIFQIETLATLRAFEEALARGPDLVHIHASHAWDFMLAGLQARAARRRGVPSVLHTHGNYDVVLPRWPPLRRRVFPRVLATADRVVVLSEGWRKWFSSHVDPQRLVVLRNPVDASRFRARDAKPEGGGVRLLFVGLMEARRKGAYDLLEWAPEVARRVPGVRFTLVGPDVDEIERKRVRGTPLEEYFEFTGPIPPGELARVCEASDILLLPSYAEGLPIILLEAMAAELAIVAAPVNGIPEAMRDGEHGLFAAPGEHSAWIEAVVELSSDAERRAQMGRAARARILDEFDATPYAVRLETLYDELLEGSAPLKETSPASL